MIERKHVLYTAKARSTGGRSGVCRSADGLLDVKLSVPGTPRIGTNPEQLFAAAWAASFGEAVGLAADKRGITLPAELVIDVEIDLCLADGIHVLRARLDVGMAGVDRKTAEVLMDEAHQTCPYARATRGNIDTVVTLARVELH